MTHIRIIIALALCLALASVASAQQKKWNELNQQVNKLYQAGKYVEATPIAEQAVKAAEKTFGPGHTNVATSLNNLASLYLAQGRYSEAEPLYKRSLAILEKPPGKDRPEVATSLNNLAELYQRQGRYSEAEPLYKRSLLIYEKQGKDHPLLASSLSNVANLYKAQGRYSEAEPLYKRSVGIYEKQGKDHPLLATSLNNLAELYRIQGRYSEAEPLYKRSLGIYEKRLGKDHPDLATSLNNLASLRLFQGRYSEAEPLFRRSLGIREERLGKEHPDAAKSLNDLANLYQAQGRYSEAEPLYKRSLGIFEKRLGNDHPDLATSLYNLASLYLAQGRYSEAEPLYKRSLGIFEKRLGNDHPDLAKPLNNLALLYHYQGRYSEAEPLYKRSLLIYERRLGKDHSSVAASLNNLAGLYWAQGRYSEAEPLYKESLVIKKKALGEDHPDVALALDNLGVLNQDRGDYPQALRMFQESLNINKRKGLPVRGTENGIANLYLDQRDTAKAEPIVAAAGYDWTRARLCLMKKDFEGAKDYYERIRVLAEKNRNADNLFISYTGLGMSWESLGDEARAADYYRKAVDFTEELRSSLARGDREKFFDARVYGMYRTAPYDGLARVLLKLNKHADALTESEYTRARVFAEWLSRRSEGSTPQVPKEVMEKDSQLSDQLAALSKNLQEAYRKQDKETIPFLEPQVKEARMRLVDHVDMLRKQYPLFAAIKYPQPMDLSQTALNDNEWVLAYHVTEPGIIIYLTKGKKLVKGLFKSSPKKDIDELVRRFREPMETGTDDSPAQRLGKFDFASGKKLFDILLADILPDLPKDTPLIIIPDGSLGVVPFEMLVLNDGGKISTEKTIPYVTGTEFFGDRNPVSYYQSITALTLARTLGKQQKTGTRTLAMVDPVFSPDDARLVKAAAEKRRVALDKLTGEKLMSLKSELSLEIPRLPLTSQLGESLKQADPEKTDLYQGLAAQKAMLLQKDLAPYHSLLFATHGYFGKDLPGIQEPVLILTLPDQPEGQDGFLRMTEVMSLKLNCDVAGLTACQTGLGRHISGEGTMGMGRAFQYAGAKSVLMSLWSVAESSSVDLVTSFFRHLREGKNKLEALKLARDEIRKNGYDHPFFWAPFILVGEVD